MNAAKTAAQKSLLYSSLRSRLHRATQDAVRSYLRQNRPQLFYFPLVSPSTHRHGDGLTSITEREKGTLLDRNQVHLDNQNVAGGTGIDYREIGSSKDAVKGALQHEITPPTLSQQIEPMQGQTHLPLHRIIHDLAKINGFEKVQIENKYVALAEGVVAAQTPRWEKSYTLFSRPASSRSHLEAEIVNQNRYAMQSSKSSGNNRADGSLTFHPPFSEEDFTLYRVLEDKLEKYLNDRMTEWHNFLDNNPVTKTFQALQYYFERFIPGKIKQPKIKSVVPPDQQQQTDEEQRQKQKSQDETEDLLILSQHSRLTYLRDVPLSHRLLTLPPIITFSTSSLQRTRKLVAHSPYRLKHNLASSILYASFVVFGALPLAYRSIRYALDYPAMVEVLTASFIGTVAYSLWYSRSSARMRQQLCVEKAVSSRVGARGNDVVLGFLVEGAVNVVVDAVLWEYFQRIDGQKASSCTGDTIERLKVQEILAGVDPLQIAEEIGLVEKDGVDRISWKAREMSDALVHNIIHNRK